MPDTCIGGPVAGAAGGGVAMLLDGNGNPADNVMNNQVPLFQHSDGNWYYRFDGVPRGEYQVRVTLAFGGGSLATGPLSPGEEAPVGP